MILVRIIEFITIIDVVWFVISFIMAIPIGKAFFPPRFPILITLIIIFLQTPSRKKPKYCSICNRNLNKKETTMRCVYCNTLNPVKMMDITGNIYYKCANKECKQTHVVSPYGYARTRFSKVFPYGEKNTKKVTLCCKYCNNQLSSAHSVVNLSLYTSNVQLAQAYRETFFYNSFGAGKKNLDIQLSSHNTALFSNATVFSILKEIDECYEGASSSKSKGTNDIPLELISLELRSSEYKEINSTSYQFRIALSNDSYRLLASEGIILLIDGKSSALENDTLVDRFLIDLNSLNTQSKVWNLPVLIGISSNGIPELEERIQSGFVNAEDMSIMNP